MNLGVSKAPGAGNIALGYNVNAQISSEEVSVSPEFMKEFSNGMIGQAGFSLSTSGNHSQQMSLVYNYTDDKQISV